jgi:hypothetical protein
MFHSIGLINFRDSALVLEVDQGILDYYYHLLATSLPTKPNKPRYPAHITIINSTENYPKPFISPILTNKVAFQYSPEVQFHNNYYFLAVQPHPDFITIRKAYNLGVCFDKEKGYHITIANIKGANK